LVRSCKRSGAAFRAVPGVAPKDEVDPFPQLLRRVCLEKEFPGWCRIKAQPFVELMSGGRPGRRKRGVGKVPVGRLKEETTMTEYLITFDDECYLGGALRQP
jgi:hypothetical protein